MQVKPTEHSGLACGQTTPFRKVMNSFVYYKRVIKEVKIKQNNAAHISKQKKEEVRSSSRNKRLNGAVESSRNEMAHGDAREGKWRGNWRMEWVASTLHTTSELGVSSISVTDAHTSAASSRLNWRLYRFKWTRPFRRKTKSGFCLCAITFQTQSTLCYSAVGRMCLLRSTQFIVNRMYDNFLDWLKEF